MSGATPTSIRNAEFDRPVHGDDAHLLAAYLEHRLGAITAAQRVRALACACPAGHA
jgi:hypothetical protein